VLGRGVVYLEGGGELAQAQQGDEDLLAEAAHLDPLLVPHHGLLAQPRV
jgi:hypothetical protein